VVVKDQQISSEDTAPRVVANVENIGNIPASNIDVVAVVFDINGNAIGASRTFVESLARGEKQQVSFTWPAPFYSSKLNFKMTNCHAKVFWKVDLQFVNIIRHDDASFLYY
jgi:hypothetical protein